MVRPNLPFSPKVPLALALAAGAALGALLLGSGTVTGAPAAGPAAHFVKVLDNAMKKKAEVFVTLNTGKTYRGRMLKVGDQTATMDRPFEARCFEAGGDCNWRNHQLIFSMAALESVVFEAYAQ